MSELRVALGQFDPIPGDIVGNVGRMAEMAVQARCDGANLLVFPEESVSGYCIGDMNRNSALVQESWKAVQQVLAPSVSGINVAVGLVAPWNDNGPSSQGRVSRNTWVLLADGCVKAAGSKSLLVNEGVFEDSRYFQAGRPGDLLPVALEGSARALAGILICQDMWDDDSDVKPASLLAKAGANLLVVMNSSPFHVGKQAERLAVARARVAETGLPLVYVNTVGVQDNGKNIIVFDGGSFCLDSVGSMVCQCPQFQEGVFHTSRGGKGHLVEGSGELAAALVFALRRFFTHASATGAVIGLSGGIDSAVSACLLSRALGPGNVLAVNMPTRFSSQRTQANARLLASNLGIEYVVHPIDSVVGQKRSDFEAVAGHGMKGITFENMQARERGNVLMTWAQETGRLVVGNGNKTEFQRGYATLYGDIIGAIMPLGDVVKTDVYRLASWINDNWGHPIPQDIIDIVASAELSSEQDVDSGKGDPFDYDVEAPLGIELVENGVMPGELIEMFASRRLDARIWAPVRGRTEVYEKLTVDQFSQMVYSAYEAIQRSVFKRVQSPPIVKVSKRAFGFDLRESILTRFRP